MVDANVKIIGELKLFLETVAGDADVRRLFTNSPSDFSRDRKMPLNKLAAMLVNLPKRSLSIELQEFFNCIDDGASSCTKGAFCLQRAKLKPAFFHVWNKWLLDSYYHYYGNSVKKWNGYQLLAVDGSTAYLFDKADVREYFGTQRNQHGQVPMARMMQVHDVLNDLTVWANIFPITQSEQEIMLSNVHHLPVNSLSLFDRAYPAYALMYLLLNQEHPRHFVIRCRSNFNNAIRDFISSGKPSKVIELKPDKGAREQLYQKGFIITDKTSIKVRMVKIKLANGLQEILLTSLCDEQIYTLQDLRELYAMRWRIETMYNKHKNQLQMEIFTGHKIICIEQDYAAGIFTANLQSLIEKQTEQYLHRVNRQRKYNYKINRNVSWAAMKNRIVKLFFEHDSHTILYELETEFKRNLEPVRPSRTFPRVRKAKRINGKYQTYTNYRRSI